MNVNQLRMELEIDEGKKNNIYKDHLGYPTLGIGHLIKIGDPEHGMPIGKHVSEERVIEAFNADIIMVLNDCDILYPDFNEKPEEVQLIIANMMFNMGLTRLSKFKNMKKAIDKKNWMLAADEMMDSKWYKQVTNRADRLVQRMRNVDQMDEVIGLHKGY